jgi:hypothetical protein
MPVVDTTTPFSNNEQITSTKLNNIMDNSFFVSGAVVSNQGLEVTAGGQMQIPNGGIKTALLETGAIDASKISTGGPSWTASSISLPNPTTITGNATVTGNATITGTTTSTGALTVGTAKMNVPTGSAPIFGARAWVFYDPDVPLSPAFSGTYSRSGTTVTVVAAGHGLKTGSLVYLDFNTGTATDGEFIITGVSTTTVADDTFTITHGASGTTSGNVTLPRASINGAGNVSSVSIIATGRQVVNFTIPMEDSNYAVVAAPENIPYTSQNAACDIAAKYNGGCQIRTQTSNGVDFTQPTSVIVIR